MPILHLEFYLRDTKKGRRLSSRIVETEANLGVIDLAAHTFDGFFTFYRRCADFKIVADCGFGAGGSRLRSARGGLASSIFREKQRVCIETATLQRQVLVKRDFEPESVRFFTC